METMDIDDGEEIHIINTYKNMSLIKPSNNILFPFDDDKYFKLQFIYPKLFDITNTWFDRLQTKVDSLVNQKLELAKEEIKPLEAFLFPPSEIYKHLSERVHIRNHMFSIKIDIRDSVKGEIITELDLETISLNAPNTYYDKERTPSMVMFIKGVYCCAILTKMGSVNLVGGYTTNEVKYTLINLIHTLDAALKKCGKECIIDISSIKLCNMAVSTAIPIAKIDNYHMADKLTRLEIPYTYDPDYQDAIIINPFPLTYSSAYVRIFPTGGMFSYGFKSLVEVNVVLCIIVSICSEFFRYQKYSPKEYSEWLTNVTEKWKNLEEMKMRKREENLNQREIEKNKKYNIINPLIQSSQEEEEEEDVPY